MKKIKKEKIREFSFSIFYRFQKKKASLHFGIFFGGGDTKRRLRRNYPYFRTETPKSCYCLLNESCLLKKIFFPDWWKIGLLVKKIQPRTFFRTPYAKSYLIMTSNN